MDRWADGKMGIKRDRETNTSTNEQKDKWMDMRVDGQMYVRVGRLTDR
jgi:hypothetical protein